MKTAAYLMQTAHAPGRAAGLPERRRGVRAVQEPDLQGLIPPYVVLTRPQGRFSKKASWAEAETVCHRRRSERTAVRSGRRCFAGITDARQKARRELLARMNTMGNAMAASPQLTASEEAKKQAYELILVRARKCSTSRREAGTA